MARINIDIGTLGNPATGGTDITEFQKAEGYLAHKWGLTGNLPSDHPFKNVSP